MHWSYCSLAPSHLHLCVLCQVISLVMKLGMWRRDIHANLWPHFCEIWGFFNVSEVHGFTANMVHCGRIDTTAFKHSNHELTQTFQILILTSKLCLLCAFWRLLTVLVIKKAVLYYVILVSLEKQILMKCRCHIQNKTSCLIELHKAKTKCLSLQKSLFVSYGLYPYSLNFCLFVAVSQVLRYYKS